MLNYIWAGMIGIGVIYGVCSGNMAALTDGAIGSAREAITLCITMCGVMALWCGLMEIASKSRLIHRMTKGISPFVSFLFPNLPKNHKAREYISINMISNILGLGWAATPAGLKAMEELKELEQERRSEKKYLSQPSRKAKSQTTGELVPESCASQEMCTFLVINISSLQLIPVNIIAYRSQYGSVNPTAVIGPGIVATLCSTLVAVIFCKIMKKTEN